MDMQRYRTFPEKTASSHSLQNLRAHTGGTRETSCSIYSHSSNGTRSSFAATHGEPHAEDFGGDTSGTRRGGRLGRNKAAAISAKRRYLPLSLSGAAGWALYYGQQYGPERWKSLLKALGEPVRFVAFVAPDVAAGVAMGTAAYVVVARGHAVPAMTFWRDTNAKSTANRSDDAASVKVFGCTDTAPGLLRQQTNNGTVLHKSGLPCPSIFLTTEALAAALAFIESAKAGLRTAAASPSKPNMSQSRETPNVTNNAAFSDAESNALKGSLKEITRPARGSPQNLAFPNFRAGVLPSKGSEASVDRGGATTTTEFKRPRDESTQTTAINYGDVGTGAQHVHSYKTAAAAKIAGDKVEHTLVATNSVAGAAGHSDTPKTNVAAVSSGTPSGIAEVAGEAAVEETENLIGTTRAVPNVAVVAKAALTDVAEAAAAPEHKDGGVAARPVDAIVEEKTETTESILLQPDNIAPSAASMRLREASKGKEEAEAEEEEEKKKTSASTKTTPKVIPAIVAEKHGDVSLPSRSRGKEVCTAATADASAASIEASSSAGGGRGDYQPKKHVNDVSATITARSLPSATASDPHGKVHIHQLPKPENQNVMETPTAPPLNHSGIVAGNCVTGAFAGSIRCPHRDMQENQSSVGQLQSLKAVDSDDVYYMGCMQLYNVICLANSSIAHYGPYDKILVDAPCSSDRHLLHQGAAALARWSPGVVKANAERQLLLLQRAVDLLRIGGIILYCTCSLAAAENEQSVCRCDPDDDGLVQVIEKLLRTELKRRSEGQKASRMRGGTSRGDSSSQCGLRILPISGTVWPHAGTKAGATGNITAVSTGSCSAECEGLTGSRRGFAFTSATYSSANTLQQAPTAAVSRHRRSNSTCSHCCSYTKDRTLAFKSKIESDGSTEAVSSSTSSLSNRGEEQPNTSCTGVSNSTIRFSRHSRHRSNSFSTSGRTSDNRRCSVSKWSSRSMSNYGGDATWWWQLSKASVKEVVTGTRSDSVERGGAAARSERRVLSKGGVGFASTENINEGIWVVEQQQYGCIMLPDINPCGFGPLYICKLQKISA